MTLAKTLAFLCGTLIVGLLPYTTRGQASIQKINTFTGTDYANLLIEVNDISGSVTVQVTIGSKGSEIWIGEKVVEVFERDGLNYANLVIEDLEPALWTPATPILYDLEVSIVKIGQQVAKEKDRIGFRSFESKGGQVFLNGEPIFLRGIAINPPGRGIPSELEKSRQFAYDYVRFMKSINVNMIRIPDDETWYDVCDELGMMVFGGNYGGTIGGRRAPEDYDWGISWLRTKKYNKISHHPSLMIYAITNETPYTGEIAVKWENFNKYAHRRLRNEWDSTRLYIGNAGYGYGKAGDICDLHRYWGWYYSSPYTFLNIRDNNKIIPFDKPVQPITFTECVGNYSGPDGRYNLTPDHKNPVSQLAWTGHAPQRVQAQLASEHQVHTFKQATELFRRLRVINHELSGIFPFTILFHNWHTIENFTDMKPKEVAYQAKISYAPVLLSWELWTPNVYAGSSFETSFHVVNDSEDFSDLKGATLSYKIVDSSGKTYFEGLEAIPDINYYGTYEGSIQISLPATMPLGNYHIEGSISLNQEVISTNSHELFVANKGFIDRFTGDHGPLLFDQEGDTERGLQKLGIKSSKLNDLAKVPKAPLLIIGQNALKDGVNTTTVQKYVQNGGRALILNQGFNEFENLNDLLPVSFRNLDMDIDDSTYPPPVRPSRNGFNVNPERPAHPVFKGLQREHFEIWSDYTSWNEQQPGMPQIYPVKDGFALKDSTSMENIAVLANYSIGLEGLALVEVFYGKGSYLVSGFDLVNRMGSDPIADKLMMNMVAYMSRNEGHHIHPLLGSTVSWGEYDTEKGVLTGINSGFMLNSKPLLTGLYKEKTLVVKEEGHLFAERPGGWNNRPGIQYVPYGRRVFGSYFHRGFGGIPEAYDYSAFGKAEFWCRLDEGINAMKTLVWNPSSEALQVKSTINGSEVSKEIQPGQEVWLENTFKPQASNHIMYQADRRIVFRETVFQ